MFKVFCCAAIVASLAFFSQRAEAAELIVSLDRLVYVGKDYAARTAVLTRYGGGADGYRVSRCLYEGAKRIAWLYLHALI